jgi:hypothetical protein
MAMNPAQRLLLRSSFVRLGAPFRKMAAELAQEGFLEPEPGTSADVQQLGVASYMPLNGRPAPSPIYQPSSSVPAGGQMGQPSISGETATPQMSHAMAGPRVATGASVQPGIGAQPLYTKSALLSRLFNHRRG